MLQIITSIELIAYFQVQKIIKIFHYNFSIIIYYIYIAIKIAVVKLFDTGCSQTLIDNCLDDCIVAIASWTHNA